MNTLLSAEHFRVTSIPYVSAGLVIFSGVPLKRGSYKSLSAKYYVTIKAHPDSLPVKPVVGQHWSVKGTRQVEDMDTGDYVMQQHTFESPSFKWNVICRKQASN